MHPKSGQIKFLDKNIEKLPPYQIVDSGICLIPEGRGLFSGMSVEENLMMGAYSKKRARSKHTKTIEWVYELFPILKERKSQIAQTLSGGEQQMLAVGRGLMSNPQLLMLDEPSLGLAPKFVMTIFETLKIINKEGVTILLVEQNVRHALELSNRGLVLEQGKIELSGKSADLIKDPSLKKKYLGA
jgi:branched-chain amino acid transport system ATP-binding protein